MSNALSIGRLVSRAVLKPACAVLGAAGLALLLAVSLAGHDDKPAKNQDKAAETKAGHADKADCSEYHYRGRAKKCGAICESDNQRQRADQKTRKNDRPATLFASL